MLGAVVAAVLLAALPGFAAEAGAARAEPLPVTLQLKWFHQFQFAGYYAALEKGWFREAGMDVRLVAGSPAIDPARVVADGKAEFGIGNSSLVIDREQGAPVMVVAAIFQHSPFVILARRSAGLDSVRDLAGRTLMVEAHSAELTAYLRHSGVPMDRILQVPHTGDARALAAGVDACTAYTTTEPYDLIRAGIPYVTFNPREAGIDYYGDTLFTGERFAAEHPELVRAFRRVALAGWRYALDHSDEIIDLIATRYAPGIDRGKLAFEAEEIRRLMISDVVDVGYVSAARWQRIAEGFVAAGLLKSPAIPAGFLFEPDEQPDLRWLYGGLSGLTLVVLGVSAIAHRFHRLNGRLQQEIAARKVLEDSLIALAATDPLTGVRNRRSFMAVSEEEFVRARRFEHPMAVLALDIDHFKRVNDTWGHPAGDRVIRAVVDACRLCLREFDIIGRLGGEEFTALLPEADALSAMRAAERLHEAVGDVVVTLECGAVIQVTVSIGVAALTGDHRSLAELLSHADQALYAAKQAGRNRISLWQPPLPGEA